MESLRNRRMKPLEKVLLSLDKDLHAAFLSMVTVGECWIKDPKKQKTEILDLYYPTEDELSSVQKVAKEAVQYLKQQREEDDWETIEKVMLIWACNAFQSG